MYLSFSLGYHFFMSGYRKTNIFFGILTNTTKASIKIFSLLFDYEMIVVIRPIMERKRYKFGHLIF